MNLLLFFTKAAFLPKYLWFWGQGSVDELQLVLLPLVGFNGALLDDTSLSDFLGAMKLTIAPNDSNEVASSDISKRTQIDSQRAESGGLDPSGVGRAN